jgi:tetratricopeptide (TPR) repeat protein
MGRGCLLRLLALHVLLLLSCSDDATRLSHHQQRGDSFFDEGRYAEASIEYRNVLQIDPNQAAAHYGLARAHLAHKELRKAYWELQETVRLDPEHDEARLQLAQLLLFGDREQLERAVAQAETLLGRQPDHSEAHLVRARALQGLGREEEARQGYEQAVEVAPGASAPLLMLANFHRGRADAAAAEPLYRDLVALEPGFVSHRALAGLLAEDPGRQAEAELHYRKALELADPPRFSAAVQMLSSFYAARDRFPEAEQTLREGIDARPGDLDLLYALAAFHRARGELERADRVVEEAARAHPDQVRPHLVLSTHRARAGDAEGALAAARAALRADPSQRSAQLRNAELLVELGHRTQDAERIAQGRQLLEAILAEHESDAEALLVRAKLELAEARAGDAISTLRRASQLRPEWASVHFLLGSALFARGDHAGARSELARALELDAGVAEARRVLAQVHASQGEHERAIQETRRLLQEVPQDEQARVLLAQSLVRTGDLDRALEELQAVPEVARDERVHFALARVRLLRGELEPARGHLLLALDQAPGEPRVLGTLLELDARQGRLPESRERIETAWQQAPGDARLMQLRGLLALRAGHDREAEERFREAIDLDPNDLSAYRELARLLLRSGRVEAALRTQEEALAARPASAPLYLTAGVLQQRLGRETQALEHYEAALRLDPTLASAKNNLAYLLAERGQDLDRALELAREAKAQLPDDPSAADTLGWVLYKKKIPNAAVSYLKEAEVGAAGDGRTLGTIRHHLALAYQANGERDKAREVVQRALAELEAPSASGGADPETAWAGELRALGARLQDAES